MRGRRLLAAFLLAAVFTGCGYQTGSMMPDGVESVAVMLFENDSLYRHAEVTFTRALTDQFLRRAHVTLRDASDADAVISGRIVEVPRIPLVEDSVDLLLNGAVLVRIEVRIDDARTGVALTAPFEVVRRADHIIPRGERLQAAVDEALRDAARDALDRLQGLSLVAARTR